MCMCFSACACKDFLSFLSFYTDHGGSELEDPSREMVPPFDKSVQCYWRIPKFIVYFLELLIFIGLGLSGLSKHNTLPVCP